ncbi:hypothetical protein [Actinoplanes sp. GCM10030250]|uniref:hypothetical protein n=1 Tax=Actinoplanes sp. GCM10030250 TaxID=3273376 RepID=UPI00360FA2CA
MAAALLAAVLVVGGALAVILWPGPDEPAEAVPAPAVTRPPTPFEQSLTRLEAQAAALTAADEKAWLAPIDSKQPAIVAAFRTIYRNLHGLGVGHVEYHGKPHVDKAAAGSVRVDATLSYCFKGGSCPPWRAGGHDGPPRIAQVITFTLRGDKYVITALDKGNVDYLVNPPWQKQQLAFAQGERVVLATSGSQKKQLKRFLPIAEKAARVVDRYAAMIGNKQGARYRVYLADDKAWKSWYGGNKIKWAIGYAVPLNTVGTDVVLRISKVLEEQDVSVIVQHELGHVATLAGITNRDTDDDQWLVEGLAEYIGAHPKKPQNTYNRYVLAEAFGERGAPKTIAVPSLTNKSDDLTVNTLYAMGHYASACMATKFGEPRLMKFADLILRQGKKPDEASRAAYGKPFKTVDKGCLSWIKSRV